MREIGLRVEWTNISGKSDEVETVETLSDANQTYAVPTLLAESRTAALSCLDRTAKAVGPVGLIWLDSRPSCDLESSLSEHTVLSQAIDLGDGNTERIAASAEATR